MLYKHFFGFFYLNKIDNEGLQDKIKDLKQKLEETEKRNKAALIEMERRSALETKLLEDQAEELRKKLHEVVVIL